MRLTTLGSLCVIFFAVASARGQAPAKEPKPFPPEIRAAWEKAGAQVGWMRREQFRLIFRADTLAGRPGEIPAFRWQEKDPAVLGRLPVPEQEFGFDFSLFATDEGLKHLSGLKNLHTLNLSEAKVTDAGLEELAAFKGLEALALSKLTITSAGLEHVTGLQQLRSLDLGYTTITNPGMKHLAGLKRLEILNLIYTRIGDAGLAHLHGLEQLQWIGLRMAAWTGEGSAALQKALPRLVIFQ